MDPIAKLKSKFTPPRIVHKPTDPTILNRINSGSIKIHEIQDSDSDTAESLRPFKRHRPVSTYAVDSDPDPLGPSQPPSHAYLVSRKPTLSHSNSPSESNKQASPEKHATSSLSRRPVSKTNHTATTLAADRGPFYLCTWRKPQYRKHKTWDGDALLIVKENGQQCTLRCTQTGKDLASLAKFGQGLLESGDQISIGGKEIEIDREISLQEYLATNSSVNPSAAAAATPSQLKKNQPVAAARSRATKPFIAPSRNPLSVRPAPVNLAELGPANAQTFYAKPLEKESESRTSAVRPSGLINAGQGKVPHPRFDPNVEGSIVMKRPDDDHQKRLNKQARTVVDVVLDPELSRALRPHQIDGVKFLYERVMGMHSQGEKGQGAILADEMGLGKTLQTIMLILTLIKQNCYYTLSSCTIERALIVCPLSLVKNWKREFRKWIGNHSLNVLCIDGDGRGKEDVERFVRSKAYHVLVIGYEKLRSCVKILKDAQPPIGLIVCDEGHRLKSRDAKTTKMFEEFRTPRRIILSGTPIQNDLSEFYAMIDFVVPGLLGEYPTFKKVFEDPIIKSRDQYCSKEVRQLGQSRSEALVKVTHDIILRRTAELLDNYLPPKHEMVVFCSPTRLQLQIYRSILESSTVRSVLRGELGSGLLQIGILRKLCNTPELLLKDLESESDTATKTFLGNALQHFPRNLRRCEAEYSGKLLCLVELLETIRNKTDDKVVVVSNFTSTLDVVEAILRKQRYSLVRLDGKTPQDKRMEIVNKFNRDNVQTSFVFLLSAKSGGVGLNLIGANRLFLLDSDWNPSTDLQAMARIHRDGQKKPCYIYRLLVSGTMDEKIYQRQLSKLGLSDSLMNAKKTTGNQHHHSSDTFTQDNLKDIFTLHTNTTCLSHHQLDCDCDGQGGGSETAKQAMNETLEDGNPLPPPPLEQQQQDCDDDDDDDDDDHVLPGFVPASQHAVDTQHKSTKDKRKQLVALHNWAHYDCFHHPTSFTLDMVVSTFLNLHKPPSAITAPQIESLAELHSEGEEEEEAIQKQQQTSNLVERLESATASDQNLQQIDVTNIKREKNEDEEDEAKDVSNNLEDGLFRGTQEDGFSIDRVQAGQILYLFAKSSRLLPE